MEARAEYVLHERRLHGTHGEILEQLDELIESLVAVRQMLTVEELAKKQQTSTRHLRFVRPLAVLALVVALAPAAAAQSITQPLVSAAAPRLPAVRRPAAAAVPPDWTYGGFVDVAYLNAFNDPPNKLFRSRGTAWHVDDVYLNMAGAYARKRATEQSRWGTELLLHAGKDDETFGFSATARNMAGTDVTRHLGLANLSYLAPAGNGVTIQGGIFGSLIGYDGLYAKDNLNYTRPWGADFTPYLMLGVNASYPFSDNLTGTFFVVNGYWHLASANNVPSFGGQVAYKPAPEITIKETVLAGAHQSNTSPGLWRFLADTIVERRTDRVIIAGEYHFSTERVDETPRFRAWWMAAQLPIRWNIHEAWSIAFRPELAWDSHGRWTLAEQTVKALTSTLEYRAPYKWAAAILRLEHRIDDSRGPQGGFFDDHEVSPGVIALRPSQQVLIFATIFTFDAPSRQ